MFICPSNLGLCGYVESNNEMKGDIMDMNILTFALVMLGLFVTGLVVYKWAK